MTLLNCITTFSPRSANKVRSTLRSLECGSATEAVHQCLRNLQTGGHQTLNRKLFLPTITLTRDQRRWQSTYKIYRWNDVLFGSSFNEIVRPDAVNFDANQYSVSS